MLTILPEQDLSLIHIFDRSDVCVIMIDATEGFTEQDSKVAALAHEAGKGCVIAVNKWDAVEKDGTSKFL